MEDPQWTPSCAPAERSRFGHRFCPVHQPRVAAMWSSSVEVRCCYGLGEARGLSVTHVYTRAIDTDARQREACEALTSRALRLMLMPRVEPRWPGGGESWTG